MTYIALGYFSLFAICSVAMMSEIAVFNFYLLMFYRLSQNVYPANLDDFFIKKKYTQSWRFIMGKVFVFSPFESHSG